MTVSQLSPLSLSSLPAAYFDGRTARRHEVYLTVSGEQLRVSGGMVDFAVPLASCRLGEALGGAPRLLTLPQGAYCEVSAGGSTAAQDALRALAGALEPAARGEGLAVRLQRRWTWTVASLMLTVALLAAGYQWGLPWAAAKVAPLVPAAVSRHISELAMQALDGPLLQPTALSADRQKALRDRVAATLGHQAGVPAYTLHFRAAPRVGANAFALPSGDIVVLDPLVKLAKDDDEIVAVVAHELGHVAYRHSLRQLMQSSVVAFVVGVYLGDVSSLASGLGALVLESRYSRGFEFEADRYGAQKLLAAGIPPQTLGTMLARLEASHGSPGKDGGGQGDLLASHPDTAARIAALRTLSATPAR